MVPLLLLLALAPGLVAAEFLLLEPESFKPLYHDGKINATGPTDQVRGPSSCHAPRCRSVPRPLAIEPGSRCHGGELQYNWPPCSVQTPSFVPFCGETNRPNHAKSFR